MAAALVGIFSWIVIGIVVFNLFIKIPAHLEVDSCVDSGGKFNYESNQCEDE
jgi:hypothetical protein